MTNRFGVVGSLSVVVLLGLNACSGGSGGETANPATSPAPPPAQTAAPPVYPGPAPLPPQRDGVALQPTPGQFVLFQAAGALPGSGGMFVYDLDSDAVKPLPAPPDLWPFVLGPDRWFVPYAISPDSRRVAYIGKEGLSDPWRIFITAIEDAVMTKPTLPLLNSRDVDSLVWSPDGSKIAYLAVTHASDWSTYKAEIHVIDVDGENDRKISANDYDVAINEWQTIVWSPDGRYVAFRTARHDGFGYVNVGVDIVDVGNGARNRLHPPSDEDVIGYFAWSPDGSRVAYTLNTASATALHTAGPDGSGGSTTGVTWNAPVYPQIFAWSPDSTRLAFSTTALGSGESALFVMPFDGSGPSRIDDPSGPGVWLRRDSLWSPDGTRLAWVVPGPGDGGIAPRDLYTARADGTDRRKVSIALQPEDDGVSLFKWSPDGTQIAYEVWIDAHDGSKLYVVGADGSGSLEVNAFLTSNPQEYRKSQGTPPQTPRLMWSADGSWLAYVAVLDLPRAEFFTVRNDLTENFKISEPVLGDALTFRFAQFAWSKDGSRLAYQGDEDGDGRSDVYVVAPNGAAYRNISHSAAGDSTNVGGFFWSP